MKGVAICSRCNRAGFRADRSTAPDSSWRSLLIASSHGGEHRMNLSAPFIIHVPPFKAVLMNTIPNVDVLSSNVAEATTFAETENLGGDRCCVHRKQVCRSRSKLHHCLRRADRSPSTSTSHFPRRSLSLARKPQVSPRWPRHNVKGEHQLHWVVRFSQSDVAGSPTLEESCRRATTQKPIIERGLTQTSRAGISKRPLPNCQAGSTASSTPLLLDAQMPWGGHPLCGRPAGYLPPGTVGQWPPCHLTMADRVKGGDPKTDQEGTTRTLASRRESFLTAKDKKGTLVSAWSASTHCEGEGPEDPGASCKAQRGNCRLQRVQVEFLFPLLRFQYHCSQNSTSSAHVEVASCASFSMPARPCDCRAPPINDVGWHLVWGTFHKASFAREVTLEGFKSLIPAPWRVVTELKTVEVSQLQCSDKVIDVHVEQVFVLDRPVLGQGRLHARCRAVLQIAVCGYKFSSSSSTGSSRISQAPLVSPEGEERWQWRSLRPLALPSFVARFAPLRCTSDAVTLTFVSLCSLYSDSPLSSRPQPLGGVGDDTPFEDTRRTLDCPFNFRPPRIAAGCFFLTKDKEPMKKRIKLKWRWKTDESKNGWTNNRKMRNNKKCFLWEWNIEQRRWSKWKMQKKEAKNREWKKEERKRKKQNKKEETWFQKRKTREKRETQRELNEKKKRKKEIQKERGSTQRKRKTKTRGDKQGCSKEERRNKEEKKGRVSKGSAENFSFSTKKAHTKNRMKTYFSQRHFL